jgi:hypothetical protein
MASSSVIPHRGGSWHRLLLIKLCLVLVLPIAMAHATAQPTQAATCWGNYFTKQSPTITHPTYLTSVTMWVTYRYGTDCASGQPISVQVESIRVRYVATRSAANPVTHWLHGVGVIRSNGTVADVWYSGCTTGCPTYSGVPTEYRCTGICTIDRTIASPISAVIPYNSYARVDAIIQWPGPLMASGYHEYQWRFIPNIIRAGGTGGCEGCQFESNLPGGI